MKLQDIAAKFDDARETGAGKWQVCCPVHDDGHASLCISDGDDGKILVKCQAGCKTADVLAAKGLTFKDLFPDNGNAKSQRRGGTIDTTYDYRDERGDLLFQVVRFKNPKDFRQRQPQDGGGWNWSVKGVRVVVFRLPELVKVDYADIVFIPEGEKDVENLHRLGLSATCNAGGAGKFSRKHAEYLRGRHVVLLQDNDDPGAEHIAKSGKALQGVARRVQRLLLPGLPEKGDVSDWLAAGGTKEQLLELAAAAPDWCPEEPPQDVADQDGPSDEREETAVIPRVADLILKGEHFAQDAGGKLYRFVSGAYRPKAEAYVRAGAKHVMKEIRKLDDWSPTTASAIVEYLRVDAPELWERPPLDVLNLKNGLLRVLDANGKPIPFDQLKLEPHDPKYLSQVQLPVAFDPLATCPAIERFVSQVFPPDATALAWEVPGILATPNTSIQKAVLLLGPGGNGKSRWLAMLQSFLGRYNCAAKSLHKLEADRFAVSTLYGKLANICPDLPSEHLAGTSVFKTITGGDALSGEYKFKDAFDFTPFCRLVFSANNPPRSEDASEGFFQRWLVIPFERSFRDTGEEIPSDKLDAMLSTPAELSGLLNNALRALPGVHQRRGFTKAQSCIDAWQEFQATTDPLAVWLDRNTIDDPSAYVTKAQMIVAYNAAQERHGKPPIAKNAFGASLKRHRPRIAEGQKSVGGRMQWCYLGIGILTPEHHPEEPDLTHFTHATHATSLTCYSQPIKFSNDPEGEGVAVTSKQSDVTSVSAVSCQHPAHRDLSKAGEGREIYWCPQCQATVHRKTEAPAA